MWPKKNVLDRFFLFKNINSFVKYNLLSYFVLIKMPHHIICDLKTKFKTFTIEEHKDCAASDKGYFYMKHPNPQTLWSWASTAFLRFHYTHPYHSGIETKRNSRAQKQMNYPSIRSQAVMYCLLFSGKGVGAIAMWQPPPATSFVHPRNHLGTNAVGKQFRLA